MHAAALLRAWAKALWDAASVEKVPFFCLLGNALLEVPVSGAQVGHSQPRVLLISGLVVDQVVRLVEHDAETSGATGHQVVTSEKRSDRRRRI